MTKLLATWREPGAVAIEGARRVLAEGAELRTVLEEGLAACERDPSLLLIGLGALPNSDGELELDAAMMDGRDLASGAVCALRGIVPAISVARAVMERTPYAMLAGDGARRFAMAQGFLPQNLMTAANSERERLWRVGGLPSVTTHSTADLDNEHGDTVTMLGMESTADGPHFVAASSTSGIAWKMPGRVGDSPIVGGGVYADDEAGAAGATGLGEELLRACASFRVVEHMRNGATAQEACDRVAEAMIRRHPRSREVPCVVVALDREGSHGAAATSESFPFWTLQDGKTDLVVRNAR